MFVFVPRVMLPNSHPAPRHILLFLVSAQVRTWYESSWAFNTIQKLLALKENHLVKSNSNASTLYSVVLPLQLCWKEHLDCSHGFLNSWYHWSIGLHGFLLKPARREACESWNKNQPNFVHFWIFQGHNSAKNKAGAESSQQKLGGHCIAFRLSPQLFQCLLMFRNPKKKYPVRNGHSSVYFYFVWKMFTDAANNRQFKMTYSDLVTPRFPPSRSFFSFFSFSSFMRFSTRCCCSSSPVQLQTLWHSSHVLQKMTHGAKPYWWKKYCIKFINFKLWCSDLQ